LQFQTSAQEQIEIRIRVDARQRLVMDHFSAGIRSRQDIVSLASLDPDAIAWDTVEGTITLRCKEGKRQCIQRESFRKATLWRSSHSSFPAPNTDPQGERTIATLRSLVRTAQDPLVDVLPATP
jgi:hypothetical protein